MLLSLLSKDIRRLRANWTSFVVLLAMPLCITALVGTVFGPSSRNDEVPRIKLAVVNEDNGAIGDFLVSGLTGQQARDFLETKILDRNSAIESVNNNEVSAVLILPKQFTTQFLNGQPPSPIELIKNPAQSFMPAIAEELSCVLTEALNAVALNFSDELPAIAEVVDQKGLPDMARVAILVSRIGDKMSPAEQYLFPPVISYQSKTRSVDDGGEDAASNGEDAASDNGGFNVFAFVMPGLIAMFLLFTAESAGRDLVVERRSKTLNRFRTVSPSLLPFFIAKSIYTFLVTMIAATIMLWGGALIFGIQWMHPVPVALLATAYSIFATGFAFLLIGTVFRERLISIFSTVIIMLMAFFGGSMLPVNTLPPFIRTSIAPLMPNHLFAQSIKRLQFESDGPSWAAVSIGLAISGILMICLAIRLFHWRLRQGVEE